jgi:hypothetical protein
MKPARKKAGLFAPPRLSIYIKSDRYPTKKKTQDKKGKKARQQICSSPPPPPPLPPSTLSSSSHMWGVEDPLPKSKRRQRMEQIWAQNNSINSQGAVVEVKTCSPLRSITFCCFQIHCWMAQKEKKSSDCRFIGVEEPSR